MPTVAESQPRRNVRHVPAPLQRVRPPPAWPLFDVPDARVVAFQRAIGRAIRARPLGAIAFAAGLGFLLGGALSFRSGRMLLALGGRHIARELLKQVL